MHASAMLKGKQRRKIFVREWRKHRGMSQERLSELTDMSPANLSLIERGLQDYTQTTLEKFARALQCEVVDILTRDPNEDEDLYGLWHRASASQRRQFVRLGKAILTDED